MHALFPLATSLGDLPTNILLVGIFSLIAGAVFFYVGRRNLITGVAEETGRARRTNRLIGQDNLYTGTKAKVVGWIRIVAGVLFFVGGIVILFFNELVPAI